MTNPIRQLGVIDLLSIKDIAAHAALRPGTSDRWRTHFRLLAQIASLQMSEIVGDADEIDAHRMVDDLMQFAKIGDQFIESIGHEAKINFSISKSDMEMFSEQIEKALQGNATFVLEEAGRATYDDQEEYESDARGWEKARAIGVD